MHMSYVNISGKPTGHGSDISTLVGVGAIISIRVENPISTLHMALLSIVLAAAHMEPKACNQLVISEKWGSVLGFIYNEAPTAIFGKPLYGNGNSAHWLCLPHRLECCRWQRGESERSGSTMGFPVSSLEIRVTDLQGPSTEIWKY